MSSRGLPLVIAGVLVLGVVALAGYFALGLGSGPDEVDLARLTQDVAEFSVPSGATASAAVAEGCTGEGSESPHADRRFVVDTSLVEVAADLELQASELGWARPADLEGGFTRHGRLLVVAFEDSGGSKGVISEAVVLTVYAPQRC